MHFYHYNFIFLLIISRLSKITQTGSNILVFILHTKANIEENIWMRFMFQICCKDEILNYKQQKKTF